MFRLNHTAQAAPQLKVKGHIDLSALNQSTRPKKKTKEEKRKEREEKNRQAGGDRPRQGGGGQNASESKKKRVRIGKERVDVNAVAGQQNGKNGTMRPGRTVREAANITRTRTANSRSSRRRYLTRT